MIDFQVTLATLLILFTFGTTSEPLASATDLPRNTPVIYTAIVNVTYKDPSTGEQKYEYNDGWFSSENRIGPSWGWLQLVRSADNRTDGCDTVLNRVEGWWVALIERGRCRFHQKIENAAVFNNASAVIIYNNEHDAQVLNMQHSGMSLVLCHVSYRIVSYCIVLYLLDVMQCISMFSAVAFEIVLYCV